MSDVRSAAYDRIDRFLRDNLDDRDYAPYAEALDVLWKPPPAQAAVIEAAKAQLKAADALRTHSCILEICIHDKEHTRACIRVEDAVTALLALEGDA
jgi:hypothetical protein